MALVDPNIQVTNIDADVLVVENPGTDDEVVHCRFNFRNPTTFKNAIKTISDSKFFTSSQKEMIHFWIGYFYAHLGNK